MSSCLVQIFIKIFDIDLYTGRLNYARLTFTREVHLLTINNHRIATQIEHPTMIQDQSNLKPRLTEELRVGKSFRYLKQLIGIRLMIFGLDLKASMEISIRGCANDIRINLSRVSQLNQIVQNCYEIFFLKKPSSNYDTPSSNESTRLIPKFLKKSNKNLLFRVRKVFQFRKIHF